MPAERIHLFVVGVHEQHAQIHLAELYDEMRACPEIKLMIIVESNYADAAARVQSLPELDIVSISNNVELSRVQFATGCNDLACALMMHPNTPWVHIPDATLNFTGAMFRTRNIRATEKNILELIKERCRHKIGAPSA